MRVIAVVNDLFFQARLDAVARATGATLAFVTAALALERCTSEGADLIVLDLHAAGDPFVLARALKDDARTRGIRLVGFYSHVDGATRTRALAAGLDHVLPRSAFTRRLPEILAGTWPDAAAGREPATGDDAGGS
jgi:CheY-like chemotaxis protein